VRRGFPRAPPLPEGRLGRGGVGANVEWGLGRITAYPFLTSENVSYGSLSVFRGIIQVPLITIPDKIMYKSRCKLKCWPQIYICVHLAKPREQTCLYVLYSIFEIIVIYGHFAKLF
jgi:hypothetical protein